LVPTKIIPLNAVIYGCIPAMLAFQSMFGVSGAGPAENLVNEESPWNWVHSYWFKVPLEAELAVTCALVGFAWKAESEVNDETSNSAKTTITVSFLF